MDNMMNFFKPMEKSLEFYQKLFSGMQMPGKDAEFNFFKPFEMGMEAYKDFFSKMQGMEKFMGFFQPMEQGLASYKDFCSRMEGFEDMRKCFLPVEQGMETFSEYLRMHGEGDFSIPYKDFYSSFIKVYEETVGKVVKVPTVGPARQAFEKYLKSVDASIKFFGASLDFYFKLQKPWMESMEEVGLKARKILSENPEDLDSFKELYDLIVSTYEERFQELFKTDAFGRTLENMLSMSLDFQKTYEEMAEEFLKHTPITTKADMDDVYKELYNIKKKMREQSKIIKQLEEKLEERSASGK